MNKSIKMLCYVVQPNGHAIEVSLSPKARGQNCLDKVCENLNIIEVDFFGLQYEKNGDQYWLNLRNPIRQQVNSVTNPIRLLLRVKFYVPPQLIQQQFTRHQFYLNLSNNLLSKSLLVNDVQLQAKLIALIAQAELGDYKCDNYDLKRLYLRWINVFCDCKECHQTESIESSRFSLLKHNSGDSLNNDSPSSSSSSSSFSNQKRHEGNKEITCSKQDPIDQLSNVNVDLYHSIIEWHQRFQGYLRPKAEYNFLQNMSNLEDIGYDYFVGNFEHGNRLLLRCHIGVGTNDVVIRSVNEKKLIKYSSLKNVRTSTNSLALQFTEEETGDIVKYKFKLASVKAANALYRLVTEKHVFYSCDSVDSPVTTQCMPNISGMFWSITPSIFKDDPEVGKKFVFDIRRTLRQFGEDVRRVIYGVNTKINDRIGEVHKPISEPDDDTTNQHYQLPCQICYNGQVSVLFLPCGDAKCCENCGPICDKCPFCRKDIEEKRKIFF